MQTTVNGYVITVFRQCSHVNPWCAMAKRKQGNVIHGFNHDARTPQAALLAAGQRAHQMPKDNP